MAIRVTHPSGALVEFPDGTDAATIQKAMKHLDGAPSPAPLPPSAQPATEPGNMGVGDTAVDAAKSLGIGLAQGGIGIASLPGNLEFLGRKGINYAANKLGYDAPVSDDPMFKTYGELKEVAEDIAGTEFYKPKTKVGEYARTIGEFAPLAAFGPGGAMARAGNVLAPALTSETAGQLTKGSAAEPYARAIGGLAGGMVPAAAMRAVSPLPATASQTQAVNLLRQEGVTDLTAGQITGSRPLRYAESVTQDVPLSGGRASQMMNNQAEQFTAAALRRVGENANRATPPVIDAAFQRIGQQFDDIGTRNNMVVDQRLLQDLRGVVDDYQNFVPASARAPIVEGLVDDFERAVQQAGPNPLFLGTEYNRIRSRFSRMSNSSRTDPELSQALARMREALDDAMERSIPAAESEAWRTARQQYGNLMRLTKAMGGAGEATAQGLLSPAQLRTAVKTQNLQRYVRGQDELGNLARAGEAAMKPLPQSGTAPRLAAQNTMNVLAALAGHSAGGLPGAVGALALPGTLARTVMSAPVQGYLANQLGAPALAAYNATRLGPLAKLPQAAQQGALVGEQRKGPKQ